MSAKLTVKDFVEAGHTKESAEREVGKLVFGHDFQTKNGRPVEQGIGSDANPFKSTHLAEIDRAARARTVVSGHRFEDDAPPVRHRRPNRRKPKNANPKSAKPAPAVAEA